jgi:ferredoxin
MGAAQGGEKETHFGLGSGHGAEYSTGHIEEGELIMAHIVAEPCVGCKFTDCVEVCPTNCFYETADRVIINPDECIDCTSCVPVCPVAAIFAEGDVPDQWKSYIESARTLMPSATQISVKKEALGKGQPNCQPKQ